VVLTDPCNEQVFAVAATTGTFYGQAMTAGDIYVIAGNGVAGSSGNGGSATAAEFSQPNLLAVDAAGNVIVPDSSNNQIRVVAAATGSFYGVRMTAGDVYLVAGNGTAGYAGNGGRATTAELSHPDGVAVDSFGNLVISDSHNNVVRVLAVKTGTYYGVSMTVGDIYTVAGDGTSGYSGDGGLPTNAEMALPVGITTQVAGAGGNTLYIADAGNSRIREVSS
jgi:secreted PhoX family phosphatase